MSCRLARAAVCSSCAPLSSLTNGVSSSAQHWRQPFQSRLFRKPFPAKTSLHFSTRSPLVGQTGSIQKAAAPSESPSPEVSSLDDNPMTWPSRSHGCGTLGEADVGVRVRLCGWVASQRSHGGVAFVNVRDHTGIVQVQSIGPCTACLSLESTDCTSTTVPVRIFRDCGRRTPSKYRRKLTSVLNPYFLFLSR